MADFLQTLVIAITIGSLYALIALGYTMVYGILKLINFAHSDVVVLGAWISLTAGTFLLPRMGIDPQAAPWWVPVFVLLLSMVLCAVIGLAIERFAYKPIRSAPRLNALITAMGVSLLLQNVGQLQYTVINGEKQVAAGIITERGADQHQILLDHDLTLTAGKQYKAQITPANPTASRFERTLASQPGTYAAGQPVTLSGIVGKSVARQAAFRIVTVDTTLKLPFGKTTAGVPPLVRDQVLWQHTFHSTIKGPGGEPRVVDKPLQIRLLNVVILVTAVALMVGLQILVFHTRLGTAMRAVSFNTDFAALMGIPIDRVISITFVLGAVLAAAAGFLIGQMYGQLQQTAHASWVLLGLKAFVAAVVGGIGNVRGAVVGGFLIAFIEQFGGFYGTTFVWQGASAYTDVAVFVLLIVVLLVKPTGLFGTTAQEKV